MVVARRDRAAMFLDLAFERDGLCIRFPHHLRECTREHAGLAAGIDRNDGLAVAGGALNRLGQLDDRPGQRSRDQSANTAAHNTAISPTAIELCWMPAAGAMKTALGTDWMNATHSLPARTTGANAAPPDCPSSLGWTREAFRCADQAREIGHVAPPVGGPAPLRAEFRAGSGWTR